MIAGMPWQVAVLLLFGLPSFDLWLCMLKLSRGQLNRDFAELRRRSHFRTFMVAVGVAALFIFRCALRVPLRRAVGRLQRALGQQRG